MNQKKNLFHFIESHVENFIEEYFIYKFIIYTNKNLPCFCFLDENFVRCRILFVVDI